MRIDKIRIKNFKGFVDNEFILNPQFTVFIGDNAKGKTSVLDALAIAVGSFLRGIDVARAEARSVEQSEIRTQTIDGQPRPQLPVEIEAFGKVNNIKINGWKRTIKEINKKTTTRFVEAKNIADIAKQMVQDSRSTGGITFPVIAYHGTGRLWAEHEERKKGKGEDNFYSDKNKPERPYSKNGEGIEIAYLRCLSSKSSSKEFLSWYKTYEDEIRKFNNEEDRVFLTAFNQCIIEMIPDGHWQDMAYSFNDDNLVGIFRTPEGKNERLLFSQLSDGYRNVIGMVADIAYRCIKLNPHLGKDVIKQTPGIVLIDELDLNLHPNWQRRIVNDLKKVFPAIQFIATTHSPFIVQSLETEELVNLDEEEGLDDSPNKYSIEDISASEMGIKDVTRSVQFLEMQERAKKYFDLIKNKADKAQIEQAKELLDELRIKYNSDPAYVALLASELPK